MPTAGITSAFEQNTVYHQPTLPYTSNTGDAGYFLCLSQMQRSGKVSQV